MVRGSPECLCFFPSLRVVVAVFLARIKGRKRFEDEKKGEKDGSCWYRLGSGVGERVSGGHRPTLVRRGLSICVVDAMICGASKKRD